MFKNAIVIGKAGDLATNSVSMDCIQVYLYSYSVKQKVYGKIVINSLAKYIKFLFLT